MLESEVSCASHDLMVLKNLYFFLPCIEQTGMDKGEDKRDDTLQIEVPIKAQV